MKLNKMQMEVLANKIADELNQPIRESNNLIKNSDRYKNFTVEDAECKKIRQIFYKYNIKSGNLEYCLNDIKNYHFEKKLNKKVIYTSSIMNDLVLESIDCKDLNEIIEKIKAKYTN